MVNTTHQREEEKNSREEEGVEVQKAGVVEHGDNGLDLIKLGFRDLEPLVEGINEFAAHVLARHLQQVLIGLQQNLLTSIQFDF